MEQLQKLLSEVQHVVDTERKIKQEKFLRGEFFNVFNILGVQTNETRTHSAFIAELLSPKGSHGCGTGFLKSFLLQFADIAFSDNELDHADVKIELFIGNKNEQESEGGRIDIALFVGRSLIIIENKIYASDQNKQLLRYDNYAKQLKARGTINDYDLLYLTLDGHEASVGSTTEKLQAGNDYFTLSYSKDIINWLIECKAIAVEKPLVRETLIQYINVLKEITNQDMDIKQQEQMFAVMSEYPEASASIFHLGFTAFRNYVFHNFCSPLFMSEAEKRGVVYEESNMLSGDKYAGFNFKKVEWGGPIIRIESDGKYDKAFYIAIVYDRKTIVNVTGQKLECFDKEPVNNCIFGWSYLSRYRDLYSNTIVPMKNGDYCKYIMEKVDEIIHEIEKKKLFLHTD